MDTRAWALQVKNPALTCEITMASSLADLEGLRACWRDLESRSSPAPTVFQSFDWVYQWSMTYADHARANPAEIRILLGLRNGKLVFVLPLMTRKRHGVKLLTWISDPFGQYGDILCDISESADDWMKAAVDFCRSKCDAEILYLRHVRADARIAKFANQQMANAHFNEQAPFLDLKAFHSDADYDLRYSSTQKKRRKKIKRHLELLGPVSFAAISEPAAVDAAIVSAIAEKQIWLEKRGRFNRIMGCSRHIEFLQHLARLENSPLKLVVTALKTGEQSVSWDINFRYDGTNYCYITSHANVLDDLSPGRLHMDQSQRLCITEGLTKFDLMLPNDPHKDSWSSGRIDVNDYYQAFTPWGRLYGAVYVSWVRPIIRKVYYSLPQNMLRALQHIVK